MNKLLSHYMCIYAIPIKLVWCNSSTSPHNGQHWQIVQSTLAFHTLIATTLFQIVQINCTSFVFQCLCHVFVHLNLKFSGSKMGNLFSTILILNLEFFLANFTQKLQEKVTNHQPPHPPILAIQLKDKIQLTHLPTIHHELCFLVPSQALLLWPMPPYHLSSYWYVWKVQP